MKREVSMPVIIAVFACVAVAVAALGYIYLRPAKSSLNTSKMMENMSKPKPPQPFIPKYQGS